MMLDLVLGDDETRRTHARADAHARADDASAGALRLGEGGRDLAGTLFIR
jgi:hypothetical protein